MAESVLPSFALCSVAMDPPTPKSRRTGAESDLALDADNWDVVQTQLISWILQDCSYDALKALGNLQSTEKQQYDPVLLAKKMGWLKSDYLPKEPVALSDFAAHINWFGYAGARKRVLNKYLLLENKIELCENEMTKEWIKWTTTTNPMLTASGLVDPSLASKLLIQYKVNYLAIRDTGSLEMALMDSDWDEDVRCFKHRSRGWAFMWDVSRIEEMSFNDVATPFYPREDPGSNIDFVSIWQLPCMTKITNEKLLYTPWDLGNLLQHVDLSNSRKLKELGSYAFHANLGLTTIILPDGLESIGNQCFLECRRLTTVTIPNNVKDLGQSCFLGCSALTAVTLPTNLNDLKNGAFRNCTNLKSIELPMDLQSIGPECFLGTALESVVFPTSVTEIGFHAFVSCASLRSITFDHDESNLSTVGHYAFAYCTSLTEVVFPKSFRNMGVYDIFRYCTSLQTVSLLAEYPEVTLGRTVINNETLVLKTENSDGTSKIMAGNVELILTQNALARLVAKERAQTPSGI